MYGGLVYASSNMRMSAAFLPAIAVSKPGTQLWIHASPGIAGDRRVGQEREVILASIRVDRTAGAAPFRDRVPGVARGLDQVHQGGMIQVRMVPVAAHAEGTRAQEGDVVRLRRIRDARPTLGEGILVRELRHVRGRAVDLVQVLVLHEDDDELIEVVRCGGRDDDAATPVKRLARRRIRGKNREAQKHEEGGGRKGRKHAPRGSHSVFSRRPASSEAPVMLVFSRPACSDNRYG